MSTKVIHIRDSGKGPDEIYVGRAGKGKPGYFGNPIKIGSECTVCKSTHVDGGSTLKCYQKYLEDRLARDSEFAAAFAQLKDKVLICFCRPKDGFKGRVLCHGQIMASLLDNVAPSTVD